MKQVSLAEVPEFEIEVSRVKLRENGAVNIAYLGEAGLCGLYVSKDMAPALQLRPGMHLVVQVAMSGDFEQRVTLLAARPVASGKA